jgi:hypothetical protein
VPALLQIPRLIDDQDPVGGAEMIDDEATQLAGDRIGVPHRAGQQLLHPPRPGLTGLLGQRPAVLRPLQAQQGQQHRAQPGPGLPAPDMPTDAFQQVIDVAAPSCGPYSVARGHRRGVRCPHTIDAARWSPASLTSPSEPFPVAGGWQVGPDTPTSAR